MDSIWGNTEKRKSTVIFTRSFKLQFLGIRFRIFQHMIQSVDISMVGCDLTLKTSIVEEKVDTVVVQKKKGDI